MTFNFPTKCRFRCSLKAVANFLWPLAFCPKHLPRNRYASSCCLCESERRGWGAKEQESPRGDKAASSHGAVNTTVPAVVTQQQSGVLGAHPWLGSNWHIPLLPWAPVPCRMGPHCPVQPARACPEAVGKCRATACQHLECARFPFWASPHSFQQK